RCGTGHPPGRAASRSTGRWAGPTWVSHSSCTADYVSIRVTAEQHNGGGVTQTVMRAFGLQ
ncbi:hypothetical protein, partial [Streptomyces sp. NPDC005167]